METVQTVPRSFAESCRAKADTALIVLFLAALVLPFLGYAVSDSRSDVVSAAKNATSSKLKSEVAEFPQWDGQLASLWIIPKAFEEHYNDYFGFRAELVQLSALVKVFGLGDSSHRRILLGREGWLYLAWEEKGATARHPRPFEASDLQKWKDVLEARANWLKRHDCHYVFVVAPEKQSVHPEFLPAGTPTTPRIRDRTSQLVEYLQQHSFVQAIDLGENLRAAARNERLYHRTDTHWNERGAFLGYSTIVRKVSEWYPGVAPLAETDIRYTNSTTIGRDLPGMLCIQKYFKEESVEIWVKNSQAKKSDESVDIMESQRISSFQPAVFVNSNKNLPRAILIGDSFSFAMLPWMAENFSRLVYLPEEMLDPKVIEAEQPDVVIQELVERKLYALTPDDPVLKLGYRSPARLAVR